MVDQRSCQSLIPLYGELQCLCAIGALHCGQPVMVVVGSCLLVQDTRTIFNTEQFIVDKTSHQNEISLDFLDDPAEIAIQEN